jgi:hypothetical protein
MKYGGFFLLFGIPVVINTLRSRTWSPSAPTG